MSDSSEYTRDGAGNMALFASGAAKIPEVLDRMGYSGLRPGQEKPIYNLLAGVDTLCLLPTGTGKTACFVVPALCHGWKTLVFSPLVALMRDQVQSLWRWDIAAAQINSSQTEAENRSALERWRSGDLQFLYVAPERLQQDTFRRALQQTPPQLVVIDEAHGASQWGDTFRPSYVLVGDFIEETNPMAAAAFTATAPTDVEDDIRRVFHMECAAKTCYFARRKNLKLSSRRRDSIQQIADHLMDVEGSKILYCPTVKLVEEVANYLSNNYQRMRQSDTQVGLYHGQLTKARKSIFMDGFMNDDIEIMVCTNAFGMGVDKSAIRGVFHYDMPGTPEALTQELGRAGRDGETSVCCTYHSPDGRSTQQYFLEQSNPPARDVKKLFEILMVSSRRGTVPVKMTLDEIARSGLGASRYVEACMAILQSSGVISRYPHKTTTYGVNWGSFQNKAGGVSISSDAERFESYRSAFMEFGTEPDREGYVTADLSMIADSVNVSVDRIKHYLNQWEKNGSLLRRPPYRGSVTELIGDINLVDFDRLEEKRRREEEKLGAVLRYLDLPDEEKHDFLEAYFGTPDESDES
jgi:RecQ family ATP-dependent DNA helicase